MGSAYVASAFTATFYSHKRESSYAGGEHRAAACDSLILALIGFVNDVAELTLSTVRRLSGNV